MVKRLPRAWSGHSQCLELRAHVLVGEKQGVGVTSVTPDHSGIRGILELRCDT